MTWNKESLVYSVDRSGRVWFLNSENRHNSCSSSRSLVSSLSESNAPSLWSLLPNPTRVDIKRVSSRNGLIWGIGSDLQAYIYVHKQDIPARVREETYENQRWNPMNGFCSQLLPTDRSHFSTEDGLTNRPKESFQLPSEDLWVWESEWQLENTFNNELLDEGWTYAVDFPATYYPEKGWKSCVRRRKWFRHRRFIGFNKWIKVEPINSDHTKEPFTDVCLRTMDPSKDINSVWTVTVLGQVYFREGVTLQNPDGTHWKLVEIPKGLEACQVTVASNGTPFVVSWTGSCLYRKGVTAFTLLGNEWVGLNGPPGGLMQVSAGENSLWAITRDKKCWILKGGMQASIWNSNFKPGGLEWSEIPQKLKGISVSRNDMVVLGMSDDDSKIFFRFGITQDQTHGQGWREFCVRFSLDTISTASNDLSLTSSDQVDSGRGDSVSMDSVHPDLPESFPLEGSSAPSAGDEEISFCWVDGSCLSSLKSGTDGDLEVGPWRDKILSGIESLKIIQEGYGYANAVEDDSSDWKGRSALVRMLQHEEGTQWVKGQLEIVNNDTLVFHKSLTHTWLCGLKDVLSVLRFPHSFTLRIRNPIEAGVADFVSLRFTSENELDEWHRIVTELSEKNQDEFSLRNLWLTTSNGELLEAGLMKISDVAVGADMVVPSDSGYNCHHPLIKGFLPGSKLKLDISIPANADGFIMNLEGKRTIAFHFNPRFDVQQVVRNTKRDGEWGLEERDGVFPFRPSYKYVVEFECIDTHIITTVSIERKKFIFKYKHRVLPRTITNFSFGGNVNIVGIRYDPKTGDNAARIEFVTASRPGHFWKLESIPNGYIWAIGYDSNVWMNANSIKMSKEDQKEVVTDDQECYIYENQRWNPLSGFGPNGLPTDRSPWSDETGTITLEKDKLRLPSSKLNWVGDWEIDYSSPGGVNESGWQFAIDFPASYHPCKRFNDFVRRRRWKRICRYSENGPWRPVNGAKLIDLSIQMNEDFDWEVLGVCRTGDAVVRRGISPDCPKGTNWESLPSDKPFISISGWYGHRLWAIGKDGFAYIREEHEWKLVDRPKETPLKLIRVGSAGVFAIGSNNALYRRTEIMEIPPKGRDWCKVCDGVKQVSMGLGEEVWALLRRGDIFQSTLAKRIGVSPNHPNGIGWDNVAEGPWSHLSLSGAFTLNR